MTKSDVNIGNYYYFNFLSAWSEDFSGAYKVTGFVSPDIVTSLNSSETLFKIYFDNYGFDTDKYDSLIDSNTLVFVATKLITTDPVEESTTDTAVYIPSTLIDYSTSYSYLDAYRLSFSFDSMPRTFSSELEKNNFLTEAKKIVKNAVNSTQEFIADNVSVSASMSRTLTTQSEYDDFNETKEDKYTNLKNAEIQYKANSEAAERKLYTATVTAQKAYEEYTEQLANIDDAVKNANTIVEQNTALSNNLIKIKNRIIDILAYVMVINPTAFDSINGLPSGYNATQLYNRLQEIVEEDSSSTDE